MNWFYQYLDESLDFVHRSEVYVKAVHTGSTTEYHYVYHYTDHLGNIRLSYGRDPETNEVAILKESHYYPFGLQHKGYVGNHRVFGSVPGDNVSLVPAGNYLDDSYRYSFGSKEEQPELGLNWIDHHARNYMPDLGRWMSPDPLSEEYSSWSPYNYVMNSPLRFIDPTGMAVEWIPTVKEDGTVSYVAERGDSANTLASQYGLSQETAEAITRTEGNTEIAEKTEISGQTVNEITGSEVLKLDLNSPMAINQRIFDQFVFANDVTRSNSQNEFHPADYYTNRFSRSVSSWGGAWECKWHCFS